MASVSARPRADGTVAYRVQFRLARGGPPTTETFDTAREAGAFAKLVDTIGGAAARAKRLALAEGAPTTPLLSEVLEDYIAAAPDITAGTAAEYRRVLARSGLEERLGAFPVSMIDRVDVEHWVQARRTTVSAKTKRPIAPKTIRNEHGLLSSLLQHAVDRGWATTNPCEKVRLPSAEHHELQIPTTEELGRIVAAISPLYRPLVLLLAATGMRWGEATALTWRDVDAAGARIRVRQAWKHSDTGGRELGAPKTRTAYRTIETTPGIIAALGARGKPEQLVFRNRHGRQVQHHTFHQYHWTRACTAAKLDPRPRVHDLRHYAASHMLAAGADLFEVSRALGHRSIKTTTDVYGHLVPTKTRPTVTHSRDLEHLMKPPSGSQAA